MMALVVIGLMVTCAKLWFDADALRLRVMALEIGPDPRWDDFVGTNPASVRTPDANAPIVDEPRPVIEPSVNVPPAVWSAPYADPEPEPAAMDDIDPVIDPVTAARGGGFEDLFGRKLPIWAGGVTLAVAGFLIVKYSIDAGLMSPVARILVGLLFGSGLITGAEIALRLEDRVRDPRVRQALSGAGIATLYASILVSANLYHLIAPMTAFVGMALTTAMAGGLSLRFGAPSAVLGLIGGLAAPALVGSGSPNIPLLSAYLALTVGALCALSRTQRWMWLGVLALIGGFGWGALLILNGVLDIAETLSIGGYTLLLGIALPLLAFGGRRGVTIRLVGSLVACAQLAALVAAGGFGALEWSLYGLVSAAVVWLSRREAALVELPAAGLAVALLLVTAWPTPAQAMLAAVIAGIAAIFGVPAVQRMWRSDARLSDAIQVSVIAAAIVALPAAQLDLADMSVSLLALLGAAICGGVAALGWTAPDRTHDPRFAILVATGAALLALAAIVIAPAWCAAPVIAVVAIAVLMLAERSADRRIEWIAAGFAIVALPAALTAPVGLLHAVGAEPADYALTAAVKWLVPALAAIVFAWRSRLPRAAQVAQPIAVLLGYVGIAQLVPVALLPLIPVALLAAVALGRRTVPAIVTAGVLTASWAVVPVGLWLIAGSRAVLGVPMLVGALPDGEMTAWRLALPAIAAAVVAWRQSDRYVRRAAIAAATLLAGMTLHIGFKHIFAIADLDLFARFGMAERTLWEMLLAGGAVALWRRAPRPAQGLAAASVAHFLGFTLVLHDPLWSLQAVGGWPLANLLLPAFGTAFGLLWLVRDVPLPPLALRARDWLQMVLIVAFAAATLRQVVHGSLLPVGGLGAGEDIARSVLLIMLAVGFLRHGIGAPSRDWRIASLLLMLAAVAKVFLLDAAGLDGLLRIASFAALGLSLIGTGWFYSRHLSDDAVLTPDSHSGDIAVRGN